jgi:hypothetical protein
MLDIEKARSLLHLISDNLLFITGKTNAAKLVRIRYKAQIVRARQKVYVEPLIEMKEVFKELRFPSPHSSEKIKLLFLGKLPSLWYISKNCTRFFPTGKGSAQGRSNTESTPNSPHTTNTHQPALSD